MGGYGLVMDGYGWVMGWLWLSYGLVMVGYGWLWVSYGLVMA